MFPSTGSLVRLAGAVMCEQDEIWQESRYFSEARMNELYDEGRTRGIDGPVDWARLEAEARRMIESGLECVSSRGFEQKEQRKLSSLSIGSAHAV